PLPVPSITPRPPTSPLFPYTTLFRSALRGFHEAPRPAVGGFEADHRPAEGGDRAPARPAVVRGPDLRPEQPPVAGVGEPDSGDADRKSTRLNSSHDQISYAVFCLKKK